MLNLNDCAIIEDADRKELDAIPDDKKLSEWGRRTNLIKRFRKSVLDHGLAEQHSKCVWCTLEVGEAGHRTAHRDHIAPKAMHGQWTFEPLNIAIACEYCNGFELKGAIDTVDTARAEYADSEFLIVHPYLDDTEQHIQFLDTEDGHPILVEGLTERGKWTIEMMKLDTVDLAKLRAQDFLLAKVKGLLSEADLELIGRATG